MTTTLAQTITTQILTIQMKLKTILCDQQLKRNSHTNDAGSVSDWAILRTIRGTIYNGTLFQENSFVWLAWQYVSDRLQYPRLQIGISEHLAKTLRQFKFLINIYLFFQ